jgi:hypothetical protein
LKNWVFIILSTAGIIGMAVLVLIGKIPYYLFMLFAILLFPKKEN